jgi:hypothetical protein
MMVTTYVSSQVTNSSSEIGSFLENEPIFSKLRDVVTIVEDISGLDGDDNTP